MRSMKRWTANPVRTFSLCITQNPHIPTVHVKVQGSCNSPFSLCRGLDTMKKRNSHNQTNQRSDRLIEPAALHVCDSYSG